MLSKLVERFGKQVESIFWGKVGYEYKGRLLIDFSMRSKKNLWGRFGGGWNWVLGIQIGSTSMILNLLVCSVRFTLERDRS